MTSGKSLKLSVHQSPHGWNESDDNQTYVTGLWGKLNELTYVGSIGYIVRVPSHHYELENGAQRKKSLKTPRCSNATLTFIVLQKQMEMRPDSKVGKVVAVGSVVMIAVEDVFQKPFCFCLQSPGDGRPGRGHQLPAGSTHGAGPGAHKVVKSQLDVSPARDHSARPQPVSKWRAFGLQGYLGFLFIPHPFFSGYQWHCIKHCL